MDNIKKGFMPMFMVMLLVGACCCGNRISAPLP